MVSAIIQEGAWIAAVWLIYVTGTGSNNQALADQLKRSGSRHKRQHNESEQREAAYKKALRGTNKVKALKLGRAYYSHLRGGNLTLQDERALTRDLNTMR